MRAGRLRDRVRIRRSAEARQSRGRVGRTWADMGTVWAEIRAPRRRLEVIEAGERADGTMEAEMRGTADVQTGDVLEVLTGGEAGTKWKVTQADRSRRDRIVAALDLYTEPLT